MSCLKKYYVTGMVRATHVSYGSGVEKEATGSFDRVVYATDAVSARNMVFESVSAKWTKGTRVYDVKDFAVVSMEVFESVLSEGGVV